MKRASLTLIGALLLLLPLPVAAQSLANAAVSPLVGETIQRLDEALDFMDQGGDFPTFAEYFIPEWLRVVNANISIPVDTQTLVVDQERDLLEFTPCLRADIAILTAELEKIRVKINEKGIKEKNVTAILAGTDAWRFGSDRLRFLVQSGTDPLGVDEDWIKPRIFEASYLETNASSSEPEEEKYCPFTSRYLPPTIDNRGCSVEEMTKVIDNLDSIGDEERFGALKETIEAERDALALLQNTVLTTQTSADEVIAVQQELEELAGFEREAASSSSEGGYYEDSSGLVFDGCTNQLPADVVVQALTDGFSLDVREQKILAAFSRQWQRDGRQRATPGLFKFTPNGGIGIFAMQQEGQRVVEASAERAEEQASQSFAVNADPVLALSDALANVEISVGRLATLATSRTKGLAVFARNFATYLLSSCVDRPCKENLEAIVRILTTRDEECMPFTSGLYLEDTSSRADKCRDAAGVTERTE